MMGRLVVAILLTAALVGCSDVADTIAETPSTAPPTTPSLDPKPTEPERSVPEKTVRPVPKPTAQRTMTTTAMSIGIPAIGVRELRVVAYTGTADDRPGTVIQNRGVAASPRGSAGGVGPGEIGNFILTAHRTTHGRPFGRVPEMQNGDHILVTADGKIYDYLVIKTMKISFRKPEEKAQQNAAVPGRPGEKPTRAMITLSTCATPEDHAEGNYWSDALGNPEHRINKIGTLVATRPAA
ncbi:class E sortase [Kribbella qitaiheensis]|uniref:class E sortase n=1 Tax=Kribbella qitaiheensis TaxID=1544730 RepID=UPI003616EE9F